MMNGCRKSDRLVVPKKSSNKPDNVGAEKMEGRRLPHSQHQALDALYMGLTTKKVNYVFDADIRDFFNKINREWLVKMIEHRIADKRVVRLIQKWLNAGILEEGKVIFNDQGCPQGGSGSPLLANVFLNYVYDLWVQQWGKQKARGDMITDTMGYQEITMLWVILDT